MKNKIIALVTLIGMSFTTFAQTSSPILIGNEDKSNTNESTEQSVTSSKTEKDEVVNEESQVMSMAKSTGKKSWSDRSTAGKILLIAGCAVIVVLAILVPGGYNSRSGI